MLLKGRAWLVRDIWTRALLCAHRLRYVHTTKNKDRDILARYVQIYNSTRMHVFKCFPVAPK